jgi:hypothetical protein
MLREWKQQREERARRDVREGKSVDLASTSVVPAEGAWFYIYPGSNPSQREHNFTTEWSLRLTGDHRPGEVEYRFRSWYNCDEWKLIPMHLLDAMRLKTTIDFSGEPNRIDESLSESEFAVELRYRTSRGTRHELHKWPFERQPTSSQPPKINIRYKSALEYPIPYWYE